MNLLSLLPWNLRRRHLARSVPAGPLRRFYEVPFPPSGADWRSLEYLALDLETTGTDARTEEIVSAGWVVLRGPSIDLSTATRRLVWRNLAGSPSGQGAYLYRLRVNDPAAPAENPLVLSA